MGHNIFALTPREASLFLPIALGVFVAGTAVVVGLIVHLRRLNNQLSRQMHGMMQAMTVLEDVVEALEDTVSPLVRRPKRDDSP